MKFLMSIKKQLKDVWMFPVGLALGFYPSLAIDQGLTFENVVRSLDDFFIFCGVLIIVKFLVVALIDFVKEEK